MSYVPVLCYVLLISLGLTITVSHVERRNPIVILISFDGFRWDYMQKTETPTLTWLSKNGVSATILNNFVTRTFPNHYSIVTGMYEDRHGIINNHMYDPVFNETFSPRTFDPKWYLGEPIWITNEKGGGGRRSAVVNWVSCNVPVNGLLPNYTLPYNSSIPFTKRIDLIMNQLDQYPETNFLATYFEEPDKSGHRFGPNSPQVIKAIQKVDSIAKYLVEELNKRDIFNEVNLILTSDHGMSEINPHKHINLDEYINPDRYRLVDSNAIAFIIPHTEQDKHEIYRNLSKVPNMTVFYKEDIPDYWHYGNNRRVTPIFLAADEGFLISPTFTNKSLRTTGNHGYNNSFSEMHPFFIAHGPAFKNGYHSEPFSIVNIYTLLCHLLGVNPGPNDGNFAAVTHLLRPCIANYIILGILMAIAFFVVLLILNGLLRNIKKHTKIDKYYRI